MWCRDGEGCKLERRGEGGEKMIDPKISSELENLLFDAKRRPATAADVMAGIIGVLIDLKPATIKYFDEKRVGRLRY